MKDTDLKITQLQWPLLSYDNGKDTYETLHMWAQIVGKIKLAVLPWVNHSWHIALHITPWGLTTRTMPYKNQNFQIDLDFIAHRLNVITSSGKQLHFSLHGISVAAFYQKIFEVLKDLQIDVKIRPFPVEIADPIPFEQDTVHSTYDVAQVSALHHALLCMQGVFMQFRGGFKGKCSPIHFFWGSFDLAFSCFSGRRAPKHPGGIPGLPDWVAEEAYSHEVSSCGFWTGNDALAEAAFYYYLYPEPKGYKTAKVRPGEAYYHPTLKEFVLPYKAVREAEDPVGTLRDFLEATYNAGADLAKWDRKNLED